MIYERFYASNITETQENRDQLAQLPLTQITSHNAAGQMRKGRLGSIVARVDGYTTCAFGCLPILPSSCAGTESCRTAFRPANAFLCCEIAPA